MFITLTLVGWCLVYWVQYGGVSVPLHLLHLELLPLQVIQKGSKSLLFKSVWAVN